MILDENQAYQPEMQRKMPKNDYDLPPFRETVPMDLPPANKIWLPTIDETMRS